MSYENPGNPIKYGIGTRLKVTTKEMVIDVVGVMPGAQNYKINSRGKNCYKVMIDGNEAYILEPMLDTITKEVTVEPKKKLWGGK